MLIVAARAKRRNAAVRTVLFPRTWRQCHAECSSTDLGCKVTRILVSESRGFWLRNRRFLVAESSFFLVAESSAFGCGSAFFGCGSVSNFGCGIAEIWLRKRRNMVAESELIHLGILPVCRCFASISIGNQACP